MNEQLKKLEQLARSLPTYIWARSAVYIDGEAMIDVHYEAGKDDWIGIGEETDLHHNIADYLVAVQPAAILAILQRLNESETVHAGKDSMINDLTEILQELCRSVKWVSEQLGGLVIDTGSGVFIRGTNIELVGFREGLKNVDDIVHKVENL